VARNKELFRQTFARGFPTSGLTRLGSIQNRRGTTISFVPDADIFGEDARFKPARLYRLARSKAYLFAGVEIRWHCDPSLIADDTPHEAVFQFPGGLSDHLKEQIGARECATAEFFRGRQDFPERHGLGRMGGRLAAVERGRQLLLLQHHSRPRTAARTSRASALL
jgi:topoisomerase-4 subunit B